MRESRLLSILLLLQARGRISAKALADEFEVSIRTIYRDMDQLSAAGVPVFAERGAAGGFQLLDGYRTHLTGLTVEEAGALHFLGMPGAASDLGMRDVLTTARRKVDAALPAERRSAAAATAERFHLDTSGWFRSLDQPEFLPALVRAIWSERKVRVRYRSWTEESVKELAPLGVVLKAGVWYFVALGRRPEPAVYRVSSLVSLELLDEGFERPRGFVLQAWWETAAAALAARLQQGVARLRVSERGFDLLGKLGSEVARAAERTRGPRDGGGWTIVEIPVEQDDNAVRDLLSLGSEAELLAPAALVERLAACVRELADLYAAAGGAAA